MFEKQPCVYIMTNKRNGTLYTGVTSNLKQRVYQHKNNLVIGSRKSKLNLIESLNPQWKDLAGEI